MFSIKSKCLLIGLIYLFGILLPIFQITNPFNNALYLENEFNNYQLSITPQSAEGEIGFHWTIDGVSVYSTNYENGQFYFPKMCEDEEGGIIITWNEYQYGTADIYAQRINSTGEKHWAPEGIPICSMTGNQYNPEICSDGEGGAIIVWQDLRGSDYDIYAQRINSTGHVNWTTNGVEICSASDVQRIPQICSDGLGGAIITWADARNGLNDIYAQRINSSGEIQWISNGIPICDAVNIQYLPKIIADESNGAIITWQDRRSGVYDIYAQKINSNGIVQWTSGGIAICTAFNDQKEPQICNDWVAGAIITWTDERSGNFDIYAQRINSLGNIQWTPEGVAICSEINNQDNPQLCTDGENGALIIWDDNRTGNLDIYAQKIDATGNQNWALNGTKICGAINDQSKPKICQNQANGAIMIWQDARNGDLDIYAQKINSSGSINWSVDGIPICTCIYDQYEPIIMKGELDDSFILWFDNRTGYTNTYAQHLVDLIESPIIDQIEPVLSTTGNIWINWSDIPFIDHYSIYRYSSPIISLNESVSFIGFSEVSQYNDILAMDGIYYYAILGKNQTSITLLSDTVYVEVDLPGPTMPTFNLFNPSICTTGSILVNWSDSLFADNYTVYRFNQPITEYNTSINILGTVIPSHYFDYGLPEGIYYYAVIARNETGTSQLVCSSQILVDLPGPTAPIFNPFFPEISTTGNVLINWSDSPNADNYTLYRYNQPIIAYNTSLTILGTISVSEYYDVGLARGIYYYAVIARNETGESIIVCSDGIFVNVQDSTEPDNNLTSESDDKKDEPSINQNNVIWIISGVTIIGIAFIIKKTIDKKKYF